MLKEICDTFTLFSNDYGLTTQMRMCHFMAQGIHETARFQTLREYASGKAYDTRTDLGNTPEVDGDGELYKGRGVFQTTGKDNYREVGKKLGLDLLKNPELLETPQLAMKAAFFYWDKHKLNGLADADDIVTITRIINGGKNGLEDRKIILRDLKIGTGLLAK